MIFVRKPLFIPCIQLAAQISSESNLLMSTFFTDIPVHHHVLIQTLPLLILKCSCCEATLDPKSLLSTLFLLNDYAFFTYSMNHCIFYVALAGILL